MLLALFVMQVQMVLAAPEDDFVTTWKTDNPGVSSSTSITIPMQGGPYDVDWDNDGAFDQFGLNGPVTHDFGFAGTYTVRLNGSFDAIQFNFSGDVEKILDIAQWGSNSWSSMSLAFSGAVNMQVSATDTPDFSGVTSMAFMFAGCNLADPDTENWDTSAVTDMSFMFDHALSANPDTSGWDTSAVTNMSVMFNNAQSANPDTGGWDTSSVANMSFMFRLTPLANPDTSGWDTSAVNNMSFMFDNALSANPDTSGWDTSGVTDMAVMFTNAPLANPDVGHWNTGLVTNMSFMFAGTAAFDADLGAWDVSSLTEAVGMFFDASLSEQNYDSLLVGWNAQNLQAGVVFDAGNSEYCSDAATIARDNMVDLDGWTITDGGRCPIAVPVVTPFGLLLLILLLPIVVVTTWRS